MKKVTSSSLESSENIIEGAIALDSSAVKQTPDSEPQALPETETVTGLATEKEPTTTILATAPVEQAVEINVANPAEISILGYVEFVENLQIHGWVLDFDNTPLNLSLRINNEAFQITYDWLERSDIADHYGEEFFRSGFRIYIPQGLADDFEAAYQNGSLIEVAANGITLHSKLDPIRKSLTTSAAIVKTPADLATLTTDREKGASPSVPDKKPEVIEKTSVTGNQVVSGDFSIATEAPAESQEDSPIIGYVERIENNQIFGWVLDKEGNEPHLVLLIADVKYPITPAWLMRVDIAQTFGDDFINSGFKIDLPAELVETFIFARQNGMRIDIIANGTILHNQVPPLKMEAKSTKIQATSKKTVKQLQGISGYVENIENLYIFGWAVNHEQSPLKFTLSINGASSPVTPEWQERLDIAGKFGADYAQSGFKILVPKGLIDTFLQSTENGWKITVLANNYVLTNNAQNQDIDPAVFGPEIANETDKFTTLCQINAEAGIEITGEDLNKLLSGNFSFPLRISRNPVINARYYLDRAKQRLVKEAADITLIRTLLKISLTFERQAETLELLGNTYFEQPDYEIAAAHYEAAAASEGKPSKTMVPNLMHCKKHVAYPKDVLSALMAGLEKNPESSDIRDRLDGLIHEYWLKRQGLIEALTVTDDRENLIRAVTESASLIYNAYLRYYGAEGDAAQVGSCNLERVLIVGDFHIPQCVRYRIEQKAGQLEAAGKTV
ncbi:MAG: hypothetical protein WAW36_02655, partial [Methylovulum miyakonense]|uniref:hypothetical protein n=1 Tax=Methylovulum miyakonense TaxID=645578 RepID=UPI003BB67364